MDKTIGPFTLIEWAIIAVVVAIIAAVCVFAAAGIKSKPYVDYQQVCLNRGGTVQLNAWNEYTGCLIGNDR